LRRGAFALVVSRANPETGEQARRGSGMSGYTVILEGVMTTIGGVNAAGGERTERDINVAPMGPIVNADRSRYVLRPFTSSTTYRNLKAHGEGVFHVTDDALWIARGAMRKLQASALATRAAEKVEGVVLTEACRAVELRVASLDDSQARTRIEMTPVHEVRLRDFFGFNRAKHAVLEAAILATRLHLTGEAAVLAEYERLQVPVDKTGGEREHQAMNELWAFVRRAAEPRRASAEHPAHPGRATHPTPRAEGD